MNILVQRLERLESQYISTEQNQVVGCEVNAYAKNILAPVATGFGFTEDEAKNVAIGEFLERCLANQIASVSESEVYKLFGIALNSTSSGFAFGKTADQASRRALQESFEHFVRYYGMYCGYKMEDCTSENLESLKKIPMTKELLRAFDEVKFYKKADLVNCDNYSIPITCTIVLCSKGNGVYSGAGTAMSENFSDAGLHALVEAWRNLRIANHGITESHFVRRIVSCGKNGSKTKSLINSSDSNWPQATVALFETKFFAEADGYLSRSLISDLPLWKDLDEDHLI